MQDAESVVGPDGRTGRRRGAHADDQNGVCVWCNLCNDFYCCGRLNCCGPNGEPPGALIDGSGSHAPDTCATSEDGAL